MCRILEQLGFEAIRQKGSHVFYRHPDGRGTVVPFHSGEDLGQGLVRNIMRDIELSLDELPADRLGEVLDFVEMVRRSCHHAPDNT
jgi:predicted RNA binding protein YcfA (HicA-like mRNA interferase family)